MKVAERGPFTHVLLNKGALTRTYDQHITVEGLQIIVNGVDVRNYLVYGLHGQIAFFYVKDLRIKGFRCHDLGTVQYAIHVCTFEDLIVDDVEVTGGKDGVHLGRGRRFTIRNGVFKNWDDAVALNAHDYSSGNPELGWIEDGVIENCHDLKPEKAIGYFGRMTAGAWSDWQPGMEVQQSDTVVSEGRLYRVQARPDGTVYKSLTRPTHASGTMTLDGIPWGVVQNDVTHTAGVRNVIFRDIFLENPRTSFSIHFDNDKYSRSYYPGSEVPQQGQVFFENIHVLHDEGIVFLDIDTPIDAVTIVNSSLKDSKIEFVGNKAMKDYGKTTINMIGCVFNHAGKMELVSNTVDGKLIELKTTASIQVPDNFSAEVTSGNGKILVDSDLTGLSKERNK